MKKIFIFILLSFIVITKANAFVYIPAVPPKPPVVAPGAGCFMQLKISDSQWRCYTEDQWNEKLKQDKIEQDKQNVEDLKYWNSTVGKGELIFIGIVIFCFLIYLFFSAIIYGLDEAFTIGTIFGFIIFIVLLVIHLFLKLI